MKPITSKMESEASKRASEKALKKRHSKRVPQSEPPRSLRGPPPPTPGVSEGRGLLGAILVRIPFKWGQMAKQSAVALG